MKMLKAVVVLTLILYNCKTFSESIPPGRETVLDRVAHVEGELILEVPDVPPLCDALDANKQTIDIGGVKLYCEREGTGTPLVVLHGGPGATHHYFHPAFSQASKFAQVIYYDQRGCGQSEYAVGDGYSIQQAAEDLETLRKALGITQWVVLGHSYGGTLAQYYTTCYPESVAGLVLVGSDTYGLDIDSGTRQYDYLSQAEQDKIRAIRMNTNLTVVQSLFNAHRVGDWKQQHFYRPTDEELALMARYEWVQDSKMRWGIAQSLEQMNLKNVFKTLPIPTILMEGNWDLTWDAGKAERLHACFPSATLIRFERSGHNPFDDEPDTFMTALEKFMQQLQPPPAKAIAVWKQDVATQREKELQTAKGFLKQSGWGKQSNLKITERYTEAWLDELEDRIDLLQTGMALYDGKRYEDALKLFEKMQTKTQDNPHYSAVALIWQGHMLDLLERRKEAIVRYHSAAELDAEVTQLHDQYGLAYEPSPYARKRLGRPFTRLENQMED